MKLLDKILSWLGIRKKVQPGIKFGWKRDLPDPRDYKFKITAPIELPPLVDLRAQCPPVYDQGELGSCFIGSTEIPLLNGNTRTLKELSLGIEGKEFWVYSITKNGKIVPAKAFASKTGIDKEIIKITLDNGNVIESTPDHNFMLRDGSYVEAQNLEYGQSLMPLKRMRTNRGYELTFDNLDCKWHYTHWMVKGFIEKRPGSSLIHHKDFNKNNNSPENLQYMLWTEHRDLHAKLCEISFKNWRGSKEQIEHSRKVAIKMHKENPGWNKQGSSKGGKIAWINAHNDSNKLEKMLLNLENGRTDPNVREKARLRLIETLSKPENKLKISENSKNSIKKLRETNNEHWQNIINSGKKIGGHKSLKFQIMKCGKNMIDDGIIIGEKTWNEYRDKFSKEKTMIRIRDNKKQEYLHKYNNIPKYKTALKMFKTNDSLYNASFNYNCKVISVEKLNKKEDTYCLTVPEYDNFAINAGVFVHNCTANALGGAYQFEEMKQGTENFIPSRLFIYYNERVIEGTVNEDSGAMIRTGMKTLVDKGVCPETMWPYNPGKFARKPCDPCYKAALDNQVIQYLRISPHTLLEVKQCLALGYPISFGFTVFDSMMTDEVARTGIVPMPGPNESMLGGHAVLCVGYDDSKNALIIRNSWGRNWGLNGYFYLPYGFVSNENMSADYWTIRLVE